MIRRHGPATGRGLAALLALLPGTLVATDGAFELAKLQVYKPVPVEPAPASETAPPPEHQSRRAVSGSLHDPALPDVRALQPYEEAVSHLPHDANGFPDWMKALNEGTIRPRGSLRGPDSMDVLDLDIIMRNTKEMPWVRFPHRAHTQWLACSNCHPAPFEARTGATRIQMADIFRGQYCGMCHDRVAFITFFSCMRCHSVPQPAAGK